MKQILTVHNLGISFSQYTKGLRRRSLKVIANLDIELHEGEILAIVGASGSGKSLLAGAVLGILPENAALEGEIYYEGQLLSQEGKEKIRGKEIALIPQSVNYLDPLQKVGRQIGISIQKNRGFRTGGSDESRDKVIGNDLPKDKVIENILQKYGLDKAVADYYPFQLSGGMARKVLLATALTSGAKVIIADEPTPGLDEPSLNEVLKDFRGLADDGCSILMITHDIEAALKIADKVAVFYAGTTLEVANTRDFDDSAGGSGSGGDGLLRHPYSKALNNARPNVGFLPAEGSQPFPDNLPKGCPFSDRCVMRTEECEKELPAFREIRGGKVRCIHAT